MIEMMAQKDTESANTANGIDLSRETEALFYKFDYDIDAKMADLNVERIVAEGTQ